MTGRVRQLDRLFERLLGPAVRGLVRRELAADLYRPKVHGDPSRLHVHPTAIVNNALFNLSSGEVTVGEYAFFGHQVAVLTGTHDVARFGRERQTAIPPSGRDVVIEDGAWVASHSLVFGPCRIGAHAVVGGGSLVLHDVEPYTVVAGRPAKLVRRLEPPAAR